ncbi:MAG: hypothetical protein NTW67_06600 [Candidatus Woesearchaeota archaeon]|nr:hypothetical protein [Candidatus Woesearchaeota archaeon]
MQKKGSTEHSSAGLFSPNRKKGAEMAINTIIMVILGLVVLVILILVIRQQVTKGASKYTEIGEDVTATGGCYSLFEGRSCVKGTGCPPPPDMVTVPGTWPDCQAKAEKQKTSFVCCKSK